ncbi:serine protease grass-like [Drosophila montana]|uniref:serine protease grass-like n=1 Tax=Drosophila montana TaxID=40370 RepID=UPI00313E1D32
MNIIRAFALALCVASAFPPSIADDTYASCTRSDGLSGHCKPYRNCPKILEITQHKPLSTVELNYLMNSKCPPKRGYVCCEEEESAGMALLKEQDCGYFGGILKTIGGTEVKLMSRPWMALLKFEDNEAEEFKCGGTLITKRFVLTAAHCFNRQELLFVRLGEHKISSATDCAWVKSRYICAPPVEDISFERIIVHEDYSQQSKHNDIALVKLSRDVEFKQHIRPICLPVNATLQQQPEEMEEFQVTGWGKTENGFMSDNIMESKILNKPRENCLFFQRDIRKSQLCAGNLGKDSCNGDSGGPLLYLSEYNENQRYVQFGIVSYGSPSCGNGYPAVYTNVGSYMRWIADKIIANYIYISHKIIFSEDDSCTRSDGLSGHCKHIRNCPKILEISRQRPLTTVQIDNLKNSKCPIPKKGYACCEEEEKMEEFQVTGWGETENKSVSDNIMESKIPRIPREGCTRYFTKVITESQLCAGNLGNNSCNGDSSGPLLYLSEYNEKQSFVQFGIVSYGSPSCGNGYPAVYTNVASYMRWIADKIIAN